MDWQTLLVTITSGVISGGVGVALVNWWANRGKARAEAGSIAADAIAKLQSVNAAQSDEWRELMQAQKQANDSEISAMKSEIDALKKQVKFLSGVHEENMTLKRDAEKRDKQIAKLQSESAEKDRRIDALESKLAEKDAQIHALQTHNARLQEQIDLVTRELAQVKKKTGPYSADRQS
jgi:chromosome segregation ATPase